MDEFVQQCIALRSPPVMRAERGEQYDYHLVNNILQWLEKHSAKQLASRSPDPIDPANQLLNPRDDTLPFIYIWSAQYSTTVSKGKMTIAQVMQPQNPLLEKAIWFLTECDPIELRYAGSQLKNMLNTLDYSVQASFQSNRPAPSYTPYIARAILRLDSTSGTLTSTHLLLLRLCLLTRDFTSAKDILDLDIHSLPAAEPPDDIPPCGHHYLSNTYITAKSGATDKVTIHDILEYHLLGAMIYIGLAEWPRAYYFLEHVLSVPTAGTAHAFMLEAYKKWTLVGLIVHGRAIFTPRLANSAALKIIRSNSKPYEAVAEAFQIADNSSKLYTEVQEAQKIFQEDGNLGLVGAVVQHHRTLQVVKLGQIYEALPISMVAQKIETGDAEAEAYVRSLIAEGSLQATVHQHGDTNVLRFAPIESGKAWNRIHTSTGQFDEAKARLALIEQVARIKALAKHVDEADRRLSMTKEFIENTKRVRKQREERAKNGGASGMPGAFDEEGLGMDIPGVGRTGASVSDVEDDAMTDVG